MKLRTISVQNVGGELLNAALICSFLVKEIDRDFVVYSLNEKLDNNLVQIYVSLIISEGNAFRLSGASPSEFKMAADVLKNIIRDASSATPTQTDDRYRLLDLNGVRIDPDYFHAHHNVKINDELLMKLLQFDPEHSASIIAEPPASDTLRAPPLQVGLQCNDYYSLSSSLHLGEQGRQPSSQQLLDRISGNATLTAAPHEPADAQAAAQAQEPQPSVAERIEDQVQTLMANMQNHRGAMQDKHDELHKACLDLEQRQRELSERAVSLDLREAELNAGLASLACAEATLAEVIKLINDVDGAPH